MTNNEVMISVRYTLDIKNQEVVQLIKDGGSELSVLDVVNYLKSEQEEGYVKCPTEIIHAFLDGLILQRRGPSDASAKKYSTRDINNNIVLRKLRIAFEMKDTDMIATLKSAGVSVSKGEISALFRAPDHKHFMMCGDQFLRNFLRGLTLKFRPEEQSPNPWANLRPTTRSS